jgi:hypothetical protein
MKPTVAWWNRERGSWSCCNMLNEMLDLYQCNHMVLPGFPEEGAVIVFHGQQHSAHGQGARSAEAINDAAAHLRWVIFVSVGDESSEFPLHLLEHPNKKVWCQTPLPTTKADRYLTEGYPAGTKRPKCNQCQNTRELTNLMSGATQECPICKRDFDFFFSGQVTHERRNACAVPLRALTIGDRLRGSALFTDSFCSGYTHEYYCGMMSRAKIAPCPSGPATPDTFRIWEALECGAIPIVDSRSLREETKGFWPVVLGDHPLPMIEDWSTLPEVMESVLSDYDRTSRFVMQWWKSYKNNFATWLAQDLLALGAK